MIKLTDKQEKFCQLVVELGNKAEAYRESYNTNSSAQVQSVSAQKLLDKPTISLRIEEIREKLKSKHNITVESLLKELEEARTCALTAETVQSSAAVSATMSKAKLLGMDKQIIDHNINVSDSGGNEW
jgi:phage terminase small subunit